MTELPMSGPECVDPSVGERILELTRPGLDPRDRALLEAHREVCTFCRQTIDLDQRMGAALGGTSRRGPRVRAIWLRGATLAAAAGAAFCMFALPPRPTGPAVAMRGPEAPHFLRPVEGEVVPGSGFDARWTEVPDAEAYEVHLSEVDGTQAWSATTKTPTWHSGDEITLVPGRAYRLVLSTVPADLLAPGAASVRFTAGRLPAVVAHRAARAQPVAYGLIAVAVFLGLAALRERRRA